MRDRLTHSGSGLDVPRDSSTCLDIITYDELTWYDTHESRRSRTAHQTASTRGSGQRGQCKRRERTTAAIRTTQYSTVRSVTRTTGHTPVSRAGAHASARSGPQTVAQRRRGLAYTRARARSLVALDAGSDALDARRPAAHLPAALVEQLVDRGVPGLGGRLKAPLPCQPRYGTGSGARRELAKYWHESQNWVAK